MSDALDRLAQAILADRDDVDLYMVYADELQRAGDPRGELMVMQKQIQETDDRAARHALQRACDAFIAEHGLLGPLAEFPLYGSGRTADVTWRYGYIRCLELAWGPDAGDSPATAGARLEAILRHPSSPFITLLVLGPAPGEDQRMSMQCFIDALVDAGPRALRTLHLGRLGEWVKQRTSTGNIGAASPVLGHLQKLTLEAGTVRIGRLAMPSLVELKISCSLFDQDNFDELCACECPQLQSVSIWCGRSSTEAPSPILQRELKKRLPQLRSVRIRSGG